jgi:hypothetical protein
VVPTKRLAIEYLVSVASGKLDGAFRSCWGGPVVQVGTEVRATKQVLQESGNRKEVYHVSCTMQTPHAYVAWGFTIRTLVQVAILVRVHHAGEIVIDNATFRASIVHLAGIEAMCFQHSSELLEGPRCRAFGDHQLKYVVQVLGGSVRLFVRRVPVQNSQQDLTKCGWVKIVLGRWPDGLMWWNSIILAQLLPAVVLLVTVRSFLLVTVRFGILGMMRRRRPGPRVANVFNFRNILPEGAY